MKKLIQLSLFLVTGLIVPLAGYSQTGDYGNPTNQKIGVHSGNLVKTVFTNAGVIGQPSTGGPRGAWIYDNNGYIGDISLMIGVEARMNTSHPQFNPNNQIIKDLVASNGDSIYHSVIISDVQRPASGQEDDPLGGARFTFQPKPGYANPNQGSIALSNDANTWPTTWPDRGPEYNRKWNGYFGAFARADQESYFVMDDHVDAEFNRSPYFHVPNSATPDRKGMGLNVKVRGLQWAQFLAQDCIFWLYEITNSSTHDYNKAIFGLICGTYVGVTGTDDAPREYDDDASFFDVQNNLVYSWDFPNNNSRNPNWVGRKVGYVGYAFLESPGNPYDGIDNDRDAAETSPKFAPSDFDTTKVIQPGDILVTISRDSLFVASYNQKIPIFKRTQVTVPATPFSLTTLGMKVPVNIVPGITRLSEGHLVKKTVPRPGGSGTYVTEVVAENAFDGVDNDFDGLIDENYFVHYRQFKKDQNDNVLFDEIVPTSFIDYKTNGGLNDPMIDERRDDGIDNDGDWSSDFDDVGSDGTSGGDAPGENDGVPTPGEPNFDALDVSESDQIGLTSFEYFTPANIINLKDDEKLWTNLRPGYFSVPEGFINGKPTRGEDGDFTFGSGVFPLLAKQTERFSFALLYGSDLKDFYKNRKVVQTIYDANYQFPTAPDKPIVKAVAGDKKVTLHWGRESEATIDPVLRIKDFEGYRIYRSLDPNFEDIRTVTDASGEAVGYQPLAQFDIPKNGIAGYFLPTDEDFQSASGYSYYLGDDEVGLAHSYVDESVVNGETYFYAVVAYDRGVDTTGIYPSENTKAIRQLSSGEYITDINTAVVVPNHRVAGFDSESTFPITNLGRPTNSTVAVKVVDESRLADNATYRVTFDDKSTDGIDNDSDGKIDSDDPSELIPLTTSYTVKKETEESESIQYDGSGLIALTRTGQRLDTTTLVVKDPSGVIIARNAFRADPKTGRIIARTGVDFPFVTDKIYNFTYKAFPVYKSPYMANNPALEETNFRSNSDDVTFDGITLAFTNDWRRFRYDNQGKKLQIDSVRVSEQTGFSGDTTSLRATFYPDEVKTGSNFIYYTFLPNTYEFSFSDQNIGNSTAGRLVTTNVPSRATKFKLTNVITGQDAPFLYIPRAGNSSGALSRGDQIVLLELLQSKQGYNSPNNYYTLNDSLHLLVASFLVTGSYNTSITSSAMKLTITFSKPLYSANVFEFTTKAPVLESASVVKQEMMKIKVVPNPYVAMSSIENPLPPNVTSGRGERRIEFRHVPNDAKIYIFTTAGDLVRTLYADGSIFNGSVYWDLRTKENLDVAAGIYFYVVESKYGKKEGKIGVIK